MFADGWELGWFPRYISKLGCWLKARRLGCYPKHIRYPGWCLPPCRWLWHCLCTLHCCLLYAYLISFTHTFLVGKHIIMKGLCLGMNLSSGRPFLGLWVLQPCWLSGQELGNLLLSMNIMPAVLLSGLWCNLDCIFVGWKDGWEDGSQLLYKWFINLFRPVLHQGSW